MIQREAIYSALWALVSGAAQFALTDRRLRHWTDVSPPEMPALFMAEKGNTALIKVLGAPTEWTLHADLYIYVHSSNPRAAPSIILNPLIDAVEVALAPALGAGGRMVQTLGLPGMVQHAYIMGKIDTDEGVLGDLAVAIIPVEILCVG